MRSKVVLSTIGGAFLILLTVWLAVPKNVPVNQPQQSTQKSVPGFSAKVKKADKPQATAINDGSVIVVDKGATATFASLTAKRPALVPDTDFGAVRTNK